MLAAIAVLSLFDITPTFLAPVTSKLMPWMEITLVLIALFWGVAYLVDPFRSGPVQVDALYDRAQMKRRWRRRLSRPERLCYDAMSLYTPIAEQGLADGLATLGPERARDYLYALREIYLEKAHDTLRKALDAYEIDPAAFPAHSPAFEATLREAGFAQLPGRLATRLEELMRHR
ncbi:MAG: hypothetical protein GYB25_09690 [Rhodobacteraceae bacterium]|nr:hypothetical protein [Paracoccaceae bacterium]